MPRALCVNSAFAAANAATTFQIFPTQLLCAMAYVKIETIMNGPYIVTGEVDLIDIALSVHGRTSYWCMECTVTGFIEW